MDEQSTTLRGTLFLAALLLVFEMILGFGIIGPTVGIFGAVVAFWRAGVWKHQRLHQLQVAAVYSVLCIASLAVIAWNSEVAFRHAGPVIAAVERYQAENGQYPQALDQLVPRYLPSVPRAGFTWVSRHYGYDERRPQLYFPAMFHGVYFYDFPTHRWTSNE